MNIRVHLPSLIRESWPAQISVPLAVYLTNKANGVGAHQWPSPYRTHSWTEIYQSLRECGYNPRWIESADDSGKPCLLPVFSQPSNA
jgi:hypothetical protein